MDEVLTRPPYKEGSYRITYGNRFKSPHFGAQLVDRRTESMATLSSLI